MIDISYFDGGLKRGNIRDLNKLKNIQLWLDITDITQAERKTIQETFGLHPLTTEDLFNANVRIKVEDFPSYLFCVFYGIQKTKTIELTEIDYILGKNFLITNHKKEIESYTTLKNNKEKLENLFKKGNEFLFHALLDSEMDNYFPVLEKIDDLIENLEEEVTKSPRAELLSKILNLKRQIVTIKKITLPQREKISFLTKTEHKFISKKALPYFRDIYDHSIRVSDTIDNYREAVGNTFDAYMSAVSNNMNEVMKVLSMIATIALPLTVISGIYGTNFSNLPGSSAQYGFEVMMIVMLAIAITMLLFFKKRKWF